MLGFAILAVVGIAILGITIYKKVVNPAPSTRQEETENDTEGTSESSTEGQSTENTASEAGTEADTEADTTENTATEGTSTETPSTENTTEAESEEATEAQTEEDLPEYLQLTTGVNLRSGPGTDYSVLESFEAGRTVKFLGKAGDWYKVRVAGLDGYMSAQYLREVAYQPGMENEVETEKQTEPPEPIYKTLKASCYLREETSKESQILGTYYTGATVQFLEDVGGWYRVKVDGMIGYMGAQFF